MPLMNQLKEVLKEKHGIQNANQLKTAVKTATGKTLGQSTALDAWKNPCWFPDGKTAELLCRAFQLQISDFIIYQSLEQLEDNN